MMKSPTGSERREIEGDANIDNNTKEILLNNDARDALKKSMARRSMAK
jgi:hypothetical protein